MERSSGARHVLYYIEHAKSQIASKKVQNPVISLSLLTGLMMHSLPVMVCQQKSCIVGEKEQDTVYRYTQRVKGVWVFLSSPKNDRPLAFSGDKYARKSLSLGAHLQITTHTSITLNFFFFFPFSIFLIFHSCPHPFLQSLVSVKSKKNILFLLLIIYDIYQ